jgi:hypothetical protein
MFSIALGVLEWRDGTWQPVGTGKPLNAGDPNLTRAELPVLLRDAQGRLVIAWREHQPDWSGNTATPERVIVRRFEEGQWAPVGDTMPVLSADVRAMSFAMTLHQGEPVVAVCEGADAGRTSLVVRQCKNGRWTQLGETLNVLGPEGGAFRPAIASDGTSIFVAWPEFLPNRPPLLFVKKWDGKTWTLVGGPLNVAPGAGSAHEPVLAILDGKPVVAWTEFEFDKGGCRQIHVKQLEK